MTNKPSTDPIAALHRAATQLVSAEADIATLQTERAAAVRDYEDIDGIAAIDRKIEHKSRTAGILRERIAALGEAKEAADRKKREIERKAAVKSIAARLDARKQAAAKLDSAAALLAEAFADLEAADDAVFANWPEVIGAAHRLSYLRMLNIDALSRLRKQRPMTAGVVRLLADKVPFDFATAADKRNAELVAELQNAVDHSPETDTAAA